MAPILAAVKVAAAASREASSLKIYRRPGPVDEYLTASASGIITA
ncbi:MAG: hypothetical protein WC312_07915 [Candidatus Omnitrophota bacterium]